MNVTFLMQDIGAVYGAERATLDLARGLAGAGVGVRVLLMVETRLGVKASGLQEALGGLGLAFTGIETSAAFSWDLVKKIRAEVGRQNAQVLHAIGYKADLHGGFAAGWGGRFPLVATVHGWLFRPDFKERFYGMLDRAALKRFSRTIVLSRFYETMLVGAGFDPWRLVRIPSGLDADRVVRPDLAARLHAADHPMTIGMLGRLSSEKRHGDFLEMARRVVDAGESVRFLVAGEGPERGRIEQQVRELGLQNVVTMPGYLPGNQFFEQTDILVLCSQIENLPYSVLEAMAWCRPVVATDVGGLGDLVVDGATGYLVRLGDAEQMADRVLALCRDRERIRRLGLGGRAKLEADFAYDRYVERHVELYDSLVKKS